MLESNQRLIFLDSIIRPLDDRIDAAGGNDFSSAKQKFSNVENETHKIERYFKYNRRETKKLQLSPLLLRHHLI